MKCSDIPEEEILAACRAFHRGEADTPDVALTSKYPVKVIMTKMQKMARKGILNYGVSLRTAWVTADEKTPTYGPSPLAGLYSLWRQWRHKDG